MAMKRAMGVVIGVAAVIALLAYLRDPPWVLTYTHGLRGWRTDTEGTRVRWTSGHAAFHVPSDLRAVTIPLRSFRVPPSNRPITALVTIDDRPAERVTFQDESWRHISVKLPPRGSRRARRIDIKLDHVHPGNWGILLGEVQFHR